MNNILLDTHIIIWFLNGDTRISDIAKNAILNPENHKYVSIASIWEVAIKISIGKLDFDGGTEGFITLLVQNDFELLPIAPEHILGLESLSFYHRDPFDRLLVATCIKEKIPIVSCDENIKRYPLQIIW